MRNFFRIGATALLTGMLAGCVAAPYPPGSADGPYGYYDGYYGSGAYPYDYYPYAYEFGYFGAYPERYDHHRRYNWSYWHGGHGHWHGGGHAGNNRH